METIEGNIKAMKKNKKGFMLDDDNWYSNDYGAELSCVKGDRVSVKYKMNGIYRNFDEVTVLDSANEPINVQSEKITSKVSSTSYRDTSFYVAYAKDLFVTLSEQGFEGDSKDLMDTCVDLIQHAKARFEA